MQIDPDEVRKAAGWNPEFQPRELDFTPDDIREAARFRAPTWIGRAGKGFARGAGETALGMARMLVTPPSDPTTLMAGTMRIADFVTKQKEAKKAAPRLGVPLYGPFSVLNEPEKLERIGRILALPIDIAGLPLSETGEKLGRGPYYPEELGEAAGTMAVFGALAGVGRGGRARVGARVAEAAPKAKAQYRVIPESEIPRAPSGRRVAPGPPPEFRYEGKKVKHVKIHQRPDVGGVKQPEIAEVLFDDGSRGMFDARSVLEEARKQARVYERGEPTEAPREAPPPEPEVGRPPPRAEPPPPRAEAEPPPRAEPRPGEPPPAEPAPGPPGRQPPLRTEPTARRGPFKGPRGEVELVRGPDGKWSVIEIRQGKRVVVSDPLPQWEARSRAYTLAGIGEPSQVTPEGKQYLVYRGYGRKKRAAAYGPKWSPELGAIMGDDVTYWAFDKDTAGRFGPKIDEKAITLKNPLVLRKNADWTEIAQAVGEYPDFITRKETYKKDFGPAKASRDKIIAEIKRRGHDGIVVTPAALDEFGGRNALTTLFGDPQVVAFKGAPQVAQTPARPPGPEPVTVGAAPPSEEGVRMPSEGRSTQEIVDEYIFTETRRREAEYRGDDFQELEAQTYRLETELWDKFGGEGGRADFERIMEEATTRIPDKRSDILTAKGVVIPSARTIQAPPPPAWPKVPKGLKGKAKNTYIADRLTKDQITAIHEGLQSLARVDDGALRLDGVGFNKMDTRVGQELAGQTRLSPKQAAMAGQMIRKYKGQLGPDLYERIYGPPEVKGKALYEGAERRVTPRTEAERAWSKKAREEYRRVTGKRPLEAVPGPGLVRRYRVELTKGGGTTITARTPEGARRKAEERFGDRLRSVKDLETGKLVVERGRIGEGVPQVKIEWPEGTFPELIPGFPPPSERGLEDFDYGVMEGVLQSIRDVEATQPLNAVRYYRQEIQKALAGEYELGGPAYVKALRGHLDELLKRVAKEGGRARKVAGFNPEKHSLATFVFKAKIRLGKTGSPEMLSRLPGKGQVYRSEKTGMSVDALIQSTREDGQFPIPEDIRLDDFLDLVARDAWAKKRGETKGRIWSKLKQEFRIGEPPPSEELVEAPPSEIAPRVPTIKELNVELREARLTGDVDRAEAIEERVAIMQERKRVTKEALEWPFNLDIPLGGRPTRPITDRMKDEGGFFNLSDLFRANRPRQRPSTISDAYQSVLDAREAMGKPPRIRVLDWMTDMGVEFYRQVFDKHVRLFREISKLTDRRHMELIHKHDPTVAIPLVQGGTGARVHAALLRLTQARKGAVADGLLPEVTRYLDFKGWLRGYRILQEKANDAFQRGDLDQYQYYRRKIQRGEGMPAGYTPGRIQAELDEMMNALPEAERLLVDQHAQKVWEIGRMYWDLLHDEGIISDQVHQQGISRGPEYIPLHRIIDDLRNDPDWGYIGVFNAATLKSLNRLEGSPRATIDPYEAMYTWATKALTDAGKNEVLTTVHGLKTLDPGGFFDEHIVNLKPGQKAPKGMSKLTYRQKGRKTSFAMDDVLATSLVNASPKDVSLVHGFMQVFRRTLQVGAVSGNLAFTPRNLMRDWAEMMALSEAGSPINPVAFARIVHRLAQSSLHILMRDESYLQFLHERAANSVMTKAIDPGYWVADVPWKKKSLGKRIKGIPMMPLRGVMEITAFSEELTKMTAWLELRKRGWSEHRAAAEVRTYAGTPDFFVHGTSTESLNLAVMFFAVRQQGKLRIWRKIRKLPKKLLSLVAASSLLAFALFRHNSQYRDEDGNFEWDHVPEDVKRNYWVILSDEIDPVTGRRAQYTIRKAETMQVFYNPIERATWEVVGGQLTKDDYWQAVTDFGTAAVPFFPEIDIENEHVLDGSLRSAVSSLNPVFKEPIEQAMNYDTYRRIPIVPRGEEELDPRFQYSPFTSPTAIEIAKAMPEGAPDWLRSPRKIEHGIRGVFAGVGEQALSIADFPAYETGVGEAIGPEDRRPFRGIEDIPILGPVTRSAYRSRPRDKVLDDMRERFYRYYRESSTIVQTVNDRVAAGDVDGAIRYTAEKPERKMLYQYHGVFQKIATALSQLRDQRNAVVMDAEIPEQERFEQAKEIYQHQLEIMYIAEGIHENILEARGELEEPKGPLGTTPPRLREPPPPPGP